MASNNVLDAVKGFSLSGSAAVFAEFVTIPLDTAKVYIHFFCLSLLCDSSCACVSPHSVQDSTLSVLDSVHVRL